MCHHARSFHSTHFLNDQGSGSPFSPGITSFTWDCRKNGVGFVGVVRCGVNDKEEKGEDGEATHTGAAGEGDN